jgi:hypothetical protein
MNTHTFIAEKNSEPNINNKMKTGFGKFLDCLNLYLDDQLSNITDMDENSKVNIYGSVTLENGAIMRATNRFHGRPWFSNVSVLMDSDELFDYTSDQGICYGQVII